jgi:hypothetical protein
MPEVTWLTAFLDVPADRWDTALRFWPEVTSTSLSSFRGPDAQFTTLVPAEGDPHVRLQRLASGPPGVHLDLHTPNREALERTAVERGGAVRERLDDLTVMTSPGGFAFCLVAPGETTPTARPLLDQVCLDIPEDEFEREAAFWSGVLGQRQQPSEHHAEFTDLERPAHLGLRLLLQRVAHAGPVTGHVDLAGAPDRHVVASRLEGLGAEVLDEFAHWTVLLAPDGRRFCVTDREPGRP